MTNAPVIALAGRRVDAENAMHARFPLANVALVEKRLREHFAGARPVALVCSAACGADLLALETAGAIGARRKVILPFGRKRFRSTSVVDRPGDWGKRFDRVIAEVEAAGGLVELDRAQGDEAYAVTNGAILDQAQRLAAGPVEAVIVWNGRARGEGDLTLQFREDARRRGLPIREILTT